MYKGCIYIYIHFQTSSAILSNILKMFQITLLNISLLSNLSSSNTMRRFFILIFHFYCIFPLFFTFKSLLISFFFFNYFYNKIFIKWPTKKMIERKIKKKMSLGREEWEWCFGNFLPFPCNIKEVKTAWKKYIYLP